MIAKVKILILSVLVCFSIQVSCDSDGKCWFISKNGTDNDSCGRNILNPCKTLDELLTIIYGSVNATSFCIATDFSLRINRTTMDKHLQIKSSNIVFRLSMYLATTNVYLDNLSLKNVEWSFQNINLHISSCLLSLAHLKIYKNLWNESNSNFHEDLFVAINESSLGYLRAENVSQIRIRNSYITGRKALGSSFFVIVNTNVTISNSTFTNNSIKFNATESTLLKASGQSDITFHNCTISGNTGYVNIIQVTNQSFLRLANSEISYNKMFNNSGFRHSIVDIEESFVSAINCVFAHNELVSWTNIGAIMWINFTSEISFERCTFTYNRGSTVIVNAPVGGKMNVTNCYFAENNNSENYLTTFLAYGGHPFGDLSKSIIYYFLNCTFVRNYAYDGGAVNAVWTTISFKNCIFMQNKAFGAGAVTIQPSTAYFENCSFLANTAIFQVGAIYCQELSSLIIINCSFQSNRGIASAGAVKVYGPSELRVYRSIFINNTSENRAGAILLELNVVSEIFGCRFINNSAVHYGCIETSSNVTLQISKTHFINNTAKDAMIFSQDNVTMKIFVSKFKHNKGGNCIEIHHDSSLTVVNSRFSENTISQGSVIYVDLNSNFFSKNSTFFNHSTELYGAVIRGSQNCNINLTESKLFQNQAKFGGAIYATNCTLKIIDTILNSNNAIDGGVLHVRFSDVFLKKSSCIQNVAESYGGCLYAATSNISLKLSDISSNQAFAGGAAIIYSNSDFSALKTKFCNNTAVTNGGAIYQRQSGHTALDQCLFKYNLVDEAYSIFGSDIRRMQGHEVRVSRCKFVLAAPNMATFSFNRWDGYFQIRLITFKTNIIHGSSNLSSSNKLFLKKAAENGWIYCNGGFNPAASVIKKNETQYASLTSVACLNNCYCYHRQDLRINVYNCSNVIGFPTNVPNYTDWLLCSNSGIQVLPDNIPYLLNITNIDMSRNDINAIPGNFLSALINFKRLKILNISNNKFSSLPQELQRLNKLEAVYIAGNPITCNCDMLWLISWMNKFLPDGTRVVRDYEKVKCSDMSTGKLIYKLTAVEMGCFPKELNSWQKAILGVGGGIIILIVIAVILVAKRWNEVKWFLFLHFNIRDKRDEDANTLERMKWDAMISYSNEDFDVMNEIFCIREHNNQQESFLERDYYYRLNIHTRDFEAGRLILSNIEEAITRSRRLIILLSRNFIKSRFCMQEFYCAFRQIEEGRKKVLIPVLLEDLNLDDIEFEQDHLAVLRQYLRTYTYMDAKNYKRDLKNVRKKIIFKLPAVPLSKMLIVNQNEENSNMNDNDQTPLLGAEVNAPATIEPTP